MGIGFITVSSALPGQLEVGRRLMPWASGLLKELESDLEVSDLITNPVAAEAIARDLEGRISGAIVAVATGGTERSVEAIAANLEVPVLILANPFNNSLASSLEAYAVLRERGAAVKLFYSPLDPSIVPAIKSFVQVCKTIHKLRESRLGQVGEPSPWILTSKDGGLIKERIGPEVIRLEVAELLALAKEVNPSEARKLAEELKGKFGVVVEPSMEDLVNAARVYLAMREILSRHDLSAITVRCFDLIDHGLTGCIGISLCNDLGIVAGCEADLDAVLTMMIISSLTGEPCWMANVVRVDEQANTVTLAHCTIATKMLADVRKSTLRSHFESGKCVSIQGPLKGADVTIARLGGGNLERMTIATGKIIGCDVADPGLCRTQTEIKLEGRVEDLVAKALGNHQVLAYGKLKPALLDFCRFKGIEPIVI
jgi:L-fucose isomerase-like protein